MELHWFADAFATYEGKEGVCKHTHSKICFFQRVLEVGFKLGICVH